MLCTPSYTHLLRKPSSSLLPIFPSSLLPCLPVFPSGPSRRSASQRGTEKDTNDAGPESLPRAGLHRLAPGNGRRIDAEAELRGGAGAADESAGDCERGARL